MRQRARGGVKFLLRGINAHIVFGEIDSRFEQGDQFEQLLLYRREPAEYGPLGLLCGDLAWKSVVASIRSRMASACGRSMRPFTNARKVNSPGSASRAPAVTTRLRHWRKTTREPWQEISIMSSAV